MDRIARIELEESKRGALANPENVELQKNKLCYSHPYDKMYLQMFYDEVVELIFSNEYNCLVFLGGGAGNECAYIRSQLKALDKVVLTDLSYHILGFYKDVFNNYNSPMPNGALACSFTELPFSETIRQYCGIAFLCLHHSVSIEYVIKNLLEVFDQIILLEPMTSPLLTKMARFGLTQRKEHNAWRPTRIDLAFLHKLKYEYDINIRTFIQMPRDFLPFLSHKQEKIFVANDIVIQRAISKLYFLIQGFLNRLLRKISFGNMVLAHISKK